MCLPIVLWEDNMYQVSVRQHFDAAHYLRGYGGKCLPKDMKALIQLGDKAGVDLILLKTVDKINEELLKLKK